MMPAFINIHTHHPTGRSNQLDVENLRFGQGAGGMTTCFSAGLHPWFLSENELEHAVAWLREQVARPEVLAVGEAGLDKVAHTPWPLQLDAFRRCVDISETFRKPLLIHCVRAFSDILLLKKTWKPGQPWIFHGFNKNAQTAQMLLDAGCYLSFGPAILRAGNHSADALRITPSTRFFLETDDTADDIEVVYQRAAAVRTVSVSTIETQVRENFERVFGVNTGLFLPLS